MASWQVKEIVNMLFLDAFAIVFTFCFATNEKQFDQTPKQNTPLERVKLKLVSEPIVRVIHQSIVKCHQFENCSF